MYIPFSAHQLPVVAYGARSINIQVIKKVRNAVGRGARAVR